MKDILPIAHFNNRVAHGSAGHVKTSTPTDGGSKNEPPARKPTDKRRSAFGLIPHHQYISKKNAIYQTQSQRPRWVLHMQAQMWRFLMSIGMLLHRLAPPRPPKPNFYRTVPTHVSGTPGDIILYFYVPSDYHTQKRLWTDRDDEDDEESAQPRDRNKMRMSIGSIGDVVMRRSKSFKRWGGYPVVINFHGGGFTLGSPHDDARWCGTVVQECNAVVVSVDYRLAPEFPFPTAVEDGVDAVLYIHKHAEELGINPDKIALSGFSSGGNMAFTVPLRLYDQQTGFARDDSRLDVSQPNGAQAGVDTQTGKVEVHDAPASSSSDLTGSSSSTQVPAEHNTAEILDPNGPPPDPTRNVKQSATFTERSVPDETGDILPEVRIKCIVPWYPSLDYTRTREERRATCVRADQELPSLFTNLFDDSYLHPPKDVSLDSPYLSPGVAPTSLLRNALPQEIIMHTCEWDMLLDEGETFRERLTSDDVGKNVVYTMVEGVPHGWDKAPNPWKPTPGVKEHYLKACKELKRVFGDLPRRGTGMSAAAVAAAGDQPRKSIVR
ncbi:AB hydrolase superfamily protein [Fulvia fulva]|uniref:AB hydrolase superfamily protein n=1 Tax=Passalora fulva TaxID=5499 RepID=A0A9Q8URU8_PASFU|nr:AB hydrolase superfamily protein [Fulvia fulva]KAK4619978.1 AB hydrolase superfamily protein [Fulvia fulva]KAK4621091.1 AB hydrolase superfamily protein [Fulvia fulva]UJO20184.1 AB hydrolase superfamily protein [Fulvia fulva]WPV16868.1 AB hydrolase superfamily protein [Fulvia fulva]WPV32724.1 AB hydrolase superfamily protein [Fulvia fulva]